MAEEREGYTMMRETVLHYVEKDGDKEVHIIIDGDIYNVYFVKGGRSGLSNVFGLPKYQPCENKHYTLDDIFRIAWKNFSYYEEVLDDE